jgi:hypothetical protein
MGVATKEDILQCQEIEEKRISRYLKIGAQDSN